TWLSERSGIASIGVVSRAQYPQAPTSRKNAITRNRFRSDTSINQLIISAPGPAHRGADSRRRIALSCSSTRLLPTRRVRSSIARQTESVGRQLSVETERDYAER